MSGTAAALELRDVTLCLGGRTVLSELSLSVAAGDALLNVPAPDRAVNLMILVLLVGIGKLLYMVWG